MQTLKTYSDVKDEFVRRGYNEELSANFFANAAWNVSRGQSIEEATGRRSLEANSVKDIAEVAKMIED